MKQQEVEKVIQQITDSIFEKLSTSNKKESISFSQPLRIACNCKQQELPQEIKQIFSGQVWVDLTQEADLSVIDFLSLQEMAALGNLQQVDLITAHLLKQILNKKPVIVLSCQYCQSDMRNRTWYAIWKKYQELVSTLEAYGIQFTNSPAKLTDILQKEQLRIRQNKYGGEK